ncbi:hypothetical protein [Streptomyces sp. NPDC001809]
MSGQDVRDARDLRDVRGDGVGGGEGRTYLRMLRVSALALLLEGALALVLLVLFGDAGQAEPGEERVSALTLLALPFLAVLVPLCAAVLSAALVLPVVHLGEALARRTGGRATGWQLLLATAVGALLWPGAGGPGWLAGTVGTAAAALVARGARRGSFVRLLVWGTAAVLGVLVLGGAGVYAGVIGA